MISLPAGMRFWIAAGVTDMHLRHIDLEAGSVLVMSYESQLTHEHGIPKIAQPCEPRISLAFRCFDS